MLLRLPCRLIAFEIHHHHHSIAGLEDPPPGYTAAKARLPDNKPHLTRHSSRSLSPIRKESSPIAVQKTTVAWLESPLGESGKARQALEVLKGLRSVQSK
jgi:hypothetical protein